MTSPLSRLILSPWTQRKSIKDRLETVKRRARRKLLFEGLEDRRLMAVVGRVVEDSIPLGGVNNGDLGSYPSHTVEVGGVIYFAADDGLNGQELWRMNAGGVAQLVEDSLPGGGIAPGSANSNPRYLTNFNGTLFFSADDGLNGVELWKVGSSGVAEMVAGSFDGGINPGQASSYPKYFQEVSGSLYFQANDGTNGIELWRTSASGVPEMVEDSIAGGGIRFGAQGSEPRYLTNVAGQLFFQANDGTNGLELWRVENGGLASLVEDSIPGGGIAPSYLGSDPKDLFNFNGTLYFQANDGTYGVELWRFNGAVAELVEDSIAGDGIAASSNGSYPSYLTSSGGVLYFQASNEVNGSELWRIGTGGIAEVVEVSSQPNGGINPGGSNAFPSILTDVSGTLFFRAQSDTNGYELWRVNNLGFAEMINSANPGLGIAPFGASSSPNHLTNVNGTLYFSADDGSQGTELWRVASSGVAEIVEDDIPGGGIAIGSDSSSPENLINVNGKLFFVATNAAQGIELWQVDPAGLAKVVESGIAGDGINPGPADSNPERLFNVGGRLYFAANDGTHGQELWRVNASNVAEQVNSLGGSRGINSLSASSAASGLTVLDGTLYFSATDGTNGTELWRMNSLGVAEIVEDSLAGGGIRPGFLSSNPRDLISVNGIVYFSADTASGTGIWRILPSGMAELVVDTLADGGDVGSMAPRSHLLTNVNGTLYFVAADGLNGNELWRVTGLGAAEIVEDSLPGGGLNPGGSSSNPRQLTNINGTLYFSAANSAVGEELWRVGTSGIAEVVEDVAPTGGIYPGAYSSSPQFLTNFAGTLYFQANDGTNGRELWRVNASGIAELVEDSIPLGGISQNSSSYPTNLTTVGGTLYFQANDGVNGNELWRIVGSNPAELVEDSIPGGGINPGLAGSNPNVLTNVNGTLYFRAENALEGTELWRVGPAGIAELVAAAMAGVGIRPGPGNSAPENLANMNGTLYFQANDGTSGYELWRINGSNQAEMVEDNIPGGGIAPGIEGSYPRSLTNIGGRIYFVAGDSNRGLELFTIHANGQAVALSGESGNNEILPGPDGSVPQFLTNVNGTLYFSADAGGRFGTELMRLQDNVNPNLTRNIAAVSGDVLSELSNSGTWNDIDGDPVALSASIGNIVRNGNGTWSWTFTPTTKLVDQNVVITGTDIHGDSSSVSFTVSANVKVLDQRIFYNRAISAAFGNGSGNPVGTIDSSKSALLPGQTASFSNVSNYHLGLNGLVVDVAGLGTNTTVADFQFAVWNGINSSGFVVGSATPTLTLLPGAGAGGSTRIKIEFADHAIRNTWLRVTMLANSNTGLNSNYTFYFGSAVAEMNIGNTGEPQTIRVNATDTSRVKQNESTAGNSVSVTNIYDINKDGRVNATDTSIVRQNQRLNVLKYFTAPSSLNVASSFRLTSDTTFSAPSISVASSAVSPSINSVTSSDATKKQSETSVAQSTVAPAPFIGPLTVLAASKLNSLQSSGSSLPISILNHLNNAMLWQATDKFFATYP